MSAEIKIQTTVSQRCIKHRVPPGTDFGTFMMGQYPKGFGDFTVRFFEEEEELSVIDIHEKVLKDGDVIDVLLFPRGPIFAGISALQWILFAASALASILLRPSIPQLNSSFNNYEWSEANSSGFVANQSNRLRPGGRVPEVFGKIRVYPDLIAPAYSIFNGNEQRLVELFVVSNGYANVSKVQILEDSVGGIYSGDYDVLTPGEPIPNDFRIVTDNIAVTNAGAPAPNDVFDSSFGFNFIPSNSRIDANVDFISQLSLAAGNVIYISGASAGNNKTYTISSVGSGAGRWWINVTPAPTVAEQPATASLTRIAATYTVSSGRNLGYVRVQLRPLSGSQVVVSSQYPSWYTGLAVGDRFVIRETGTVHTVTGKSSVSIKQGDGSTDKLITLSFTPDATTTAYTAFLKLAPTNYLPPPPAADGGFRNWSTWYTVPGNDTTEVWIDFTFAQGLFVQFSGRPPQEHAVGFNIEIRSTVTGVTTAHYAAWSAATRQPRRWTHRIAVPLGSYAIRWRRSNDAYTQTGTTVSSEAATVTRLASARKAQSSTLPKVTALLLRFDSQLGQIQSSRSFNCLTDRLLPDYRTNSNPPLTNYRVGHSVADAVMYTLLEQSHYPYDSIDVAGLYAQFGNDIFNGIFSDRASADDQINELLYPFHGYAYRRAGTIYFFKDKKQTVPKTLFNKLNKVEPESRVMSFGLANDPDGVRVTFIDSANNYKQVALEYPPNLDFFQPVDIYLNGITDYEKAYRFAVRYWDTIINRRDIMSITTTEEGALLSPGDMISVTDHLREDPPIDGQLISVSGNKITIDQDATIAINDIVRLRSKNGDELLQSKVTGVAGRVITIANSVTYTPSAKGSSQVGLLYQIINPVDGPKANWMIQSVSPKTDGSVKLELVNYSDKVYDADNIVVPPKLVKYSF